MNVLQIFSSPHRLGCIPGECTSGLLATCITSFVSWSFFLPCSQRTEQESTLRAKQQQPAFGSSSWNHIKMIQAVARMLIWERADPLTWTYASEGNGWYSLLPIFNLIFYTYSFNMCLVYMCAHARARAHTHVCVEIREQILELTLSFHHVDWKDQAQFISHGKGFCNLFF